MRDNSKVFNIKLNLVNMKISSDRILCKAGDSVVIVANILKGDTCKDLTNKKIDMISIASLPDGGEIKLEHKYDEGGIKIVDSVQGVVEINVKSSFTQDTCTVLNEIVIYDDNETIITNSFVMSVQPSNTRTIVKYAQDEVATLQALAKTLHEYNNEVVSFRGEMDKFKADMSNVETTMETLHSNIVVAEGVRAIKEDERLSAELNRTTKEDVRIVKENARILEEESRVLSEEDRIVNENNRIIAENIRGKSEAVRENAETLRQNNFITNEEVRKQGEKHRVERDRLREEKVFGWESSENARKTSEILRVRDENDRAVVEAQRSDNEKIRVAQETIRQDTYTNFNNAELDRVESEQTRVGSELVRTKAEVDRIANETARINAETNRDSVFNAAQGSRDNIFKASESTRTTEFTNNQNNMESRYVNKEDNRDSKYVVAENIRTANHEESEAHRAAQYAKAETDRGVLFDNAEVARTTQYVAAEASRGNHYDVAETDRNSLFNVEEDKRKSNESGRVTAETTRVSAEEVRVVAENKRQADYVIAESNRDTTYNTSEAQRNSLFDTEEEKRKVNEGNRVSGEATRVLDENARKLQETARVSAETTRVNQENTRKTNETNRVNSETSRVSAENLRVTAEANRDKKIVEVEKKIVENTSQVDQITKDVNVVDKKVINVEKYQANSNIDIEGNTHEDLKGRLLADNVILLDRMNNANYLPYEGEFITANNSYEGRTKDLEVRGRTLQNIWSMDRLPWFTTGTENQGKYVVSATKTSITLQITSHMSSASWKYIGFGYVKYMLFKPNTKYTIKANVNDGISISICNGDGTNTSSSVGYFKNGICTITTNSMDNVTSNILYISTLPNEVGTYIISDMTILEGDYTNKPIPPYFEGIRSVGEQGENVEVVSCGKNLCKGVLERCFVGGVDAITFYTPSDTSSETRSVIIPCKKGKTYKGSKNGGNRNTISFFKNYPKDGDKTSLIIIDEATITAPDDGWLVYYVTNTSSDVPKNIQLEEGTVATPYEPYKEHRQALPLAEPLRGVGNVKDTDKVTRIGKVVLDGSESWHSFNTDNPNYNEAIGNGMSKIKGAITTSNSLSDKVAQTEYNRFVFLGNTTGYYRIPKTIATDLVKFKAWLRANPTTVYYELAEPIPRTSELEQLRTYDGVTNIFTEGSLIAPTVSAKIPSNVPAVISDVNKENALLKSNVNTLNTENTEVKATNETQDVLIDTTMLATDEMYMMIEPLLSQQPQVLNIKGGSAKMVDMYVAMVIRGLKTIDEVPARYRAEVQAILDKLEK